MIDEPTTWEVNAQAWTPSNYDGEYEGPITLRRALALSRNIAAIKVAETTGYDEVAGLWRRVGAGTPPRPYPSIALGVFEATPLQVASAYTLFPNYGAIRPLRAILRIVTRRQRDVRFQPTDAAHRRATRHDVSGHEHDAQRHQRGDRRRRASGGLRRTMPPASQARPTTCATRGSSASRRSC